MIRSHRSICAILVQYKLLNLYFQGQQWQTVHWSEGINNKKRETLINSSMWSWIVKFQVPWRKREEYTRDWVNDCVLVLINGGVSGACCHIVYHVVLEWIGFAVPGGFRINIEFTKCQYARLFKNIQGILFLILKFQ